MDIKGHPSNYQSKKHKKHKRKNIKGYPSNYQSISVRLQFSDLSITTFKKGRNEEYVLIPF